MKIHPYAGLLILMILGAGIPISFVLGKLNIIDENIATIIFGTCWVLMIAFLILSFIFGWSNYFDISGSHPNDGSYP
jgi:hypothetical protein